MIKPRIRKSYGNSTVWVCFAGSKLGYGFSPIEAYTDWLNKPVLVVKEWSDD